MPLCTASAICSAGTTAPDATTSIFSRLAVMTPTRRA
jgi:hypothetical protein